VSQKNRNATINEWDLCFSGVYRNRTVAVPTVYRNCTAYVPKLHRQNWHVPNTTLIVPKFTCTEIVHPLSRKCHVPIWILPLTRTVLTGTRAQRSGRVMELRLECGNGIRVDSGFRKRVPLRYCSDTWIRKSFVPPAKKWRYMYLVYSVASPPSDLLLIYNVSPSPVATHKAIVNVTLRPKILDIKLVLSNCTHSNKAVVRSTFNKGRWLDYVHLFNFATFISASKYDISV